MLSAKIGWRFSDGRGFCQKNAPTGGSRVLHGSVFMPPKLSGAAGNFLTSSSYPEALLQTRPAQAAHPPSKLLGPEPAKHLWVSERFVAGGSKKFWEVSWNFVLTSFFGGKTHSVSYQTLKLAIGWDFSKVFQSIWSLNSHSNLKGLSGAQLIHANIQRQAHVSVSPEKLRVIHSEQESVASKYCPKSNKLRAAYPLLGVSLLWTKYCLEEQEYRFQGLDSSRQNLNRQGKS